MTHSRSSFGSSHLLFARPCLFATKANSTPIIQAVHLRQCATPEPGIEMTVSATLDLINPRSREFTKPSAFGFRKKERKKKGGKNKQSRETVCRLPNLAYSCMVRSYFFFFPLYPSFTPPFVASYVSGCIAYYREENPFSSSSKLLHTIFSHVV